MPYWKKQVNRMQAIILAAGKSTRTYPLTLTKPKPLLKVANKQIILHTLEQLVGVVDEVILVVGYKEEMIKKLVGDTFKKIKIRYVTQDVQDGTGGAVLACKSLLKDRFAVINGDDLYAKQDIKKCLSFPYSILAKEVDDISRFGEVLLKDDSFKGIKEKPPSTRKGLAYTGLMVLSKEILGIPLKKSKRGEYEVVDFMTEAGRSGKTVSCVTVSRYWFAISYPWNLLEANEYFLENMVPEKKGVVEKGAVLKGKVSVGKGTVIKSGAYIEGPVMFGNDCRIGPNCYIRGFTTADDGVKIGNAVEVKNSILGKKTSVGHLSYIGDSVIGDRVNFGAGTITANLRHDNKNVKTPVKGKIVDTTRRKLGTVIGDHVHTGIHTSIYPGRKIWPECSTLPGSVVDKDIMR